MTTINRLNATISDHAVAANFVALFLLVSIGVASAIAIVRTGDLAQSSFDAVLQSPSATQAPVATTPATPAQTAPQASTASISVTSSSPLSLQTQPAHADSLLQPAANPVHDSSRSTYTLQPSTNTVQLTGGASLQSTASIL